MKRRKQDEKYQTRKIKRMIFTYGSVLFPIATGRPVNYYRNGKWHRTEDVKRIIRSDKERIIVETKGFVYNIQFQQEEAASVMAAA